jgi:hypothetical protein
MKNYLSFFTFLLFVSFIIIYAACNGESTKAEDGGTTTIYKIVNNGNGGVTSITDTSDEYELDVAQFIPAEDSGTFPSNMPIMIFFDDKIYINSIENNYTVTADGQLIGGTITINESSEGYAVITFMPDGGFPSGSVIVITLKVGLQDDGGNGLYTEYVLTFYTTSPSTTSFDSNKGFESGTSGVVFVGDGYILSGTSGAVSPYEGSRYAVITSGNYLVSSDYAIDYASSIVMLGPINSNLSSINFYYDFASAEFQEFVDSAFDDTAMVTILGPNGSRSFILTSVNIIGTANTDCGGFIGLPDAGDEYAGHTGWINKSLSFPSVGSPAYIIFTITDVSDTIYSSALAVDDISY